MNSKEYRNIITAKDILDYSTLEITLKELFAMKNTKIISEIERILKQNKISKPDLHSDPNNQATDYFKVDLDSNDIDEIADMFYDLEVRHIDENGDTTSTCAFYASLADKWAALNS